MRTLVLKAWLVAATVCLNSNPGTAKEADWTGFECQSADGLLKEFNINLRKGTYDDGEGLKKLHQVSDIKITLRGPNPFSFSTPMGPIISSLELDRRTLLLNDQTYIPDRGINRLVQYQCQIVPAIDFQAGRAF